MATDVNQLIDNATPEQWEQIEQIKQQCLESQTKQYPIEELRDAAARMWKMLGDEVEPIVVQAPSPLAAVKWTAVIRLLVAERNAAGQELYEDELTPEFLNAQVAEREAADEKAFIKEYVSEPKYVGIFWRVWAGWYSGAEVLGVEFEKEKLDLFRDWANRIGVWCAYDGLVVVGANPVELHWEGDRLHNEAGPAIKYADGWGLYVIHGVTVDEQIVMKPETQKLEQITKETNAEIKRIRIERFGWQRYIEEMKATVVNERTNEIEQTMEALFLLSDNIAVLICHCPSTGKVFAMEVPPETKTCEEAQNWLRNQPGKAIGAS